MARRAGGSFVLRVEDIDRQRCTPALERAALDDLRWLGLDWDEGPDVGGPFGPYRQSERTDRYDALLEALSAAGRTYVCACSRADIRRAQRAPHLHRGGERPYPGTCRGAHARLRPDRGGYRLDVQGLGEGAVVRWQDACLGPQREDVRETSGDLLLGRPGAPTYHLAAVADDDAMGITHVVRGRDLAGSTARHILLRRALAEATGAPPPPPLRYAHHPLVTAPDGRKLSKRDGAAALAALRAAGVPAARLRAALAVAVGLLPPGTRAASMEDLVDAAAGCQGWRDATLPPWLAVEYPLGEA